MLEVRGMHIKQAALHYAAYKMKGRINNKNIQNWLQMIMFKVVPMKKYYLTYHVQSLKSCYLIRGPNVSTEWIWLYHQLTRKSEDIIASKNDDA